MRYSDVEANAVCFGAMGVGVLCDPLMCYPPYTAPRFNAVSFGAMGVEILCDPLLYPAYTAPRLNAARFGAMIADVRATLCCAASPPPAVRLGSTLPILIPFTAVSTGVTRIPFGPLWCCPCVADLVDGSLLTVVVWDAPYILHFKWVRPLYYCCDR